MSNHRANLIYALESFAKFHLATDPSAQIVTMDSSEELCARWSGAYIKRDWFLSEFSDEQRLALADFDDELQRSTAKYNRLPPILKWVTTADGKGLCQRAAQLLTLLSPP